MAYVALSRVRSLSGVYLTEFTPDSIMASRPCVEEVNRLRQTFRSDLSCYELPHKRGTKRKMTGFSDAPTAKKQRKLASCNQTSQSLKRKCNDLDSSPPAKRQKTNETLIDARDPRDINPRESGVWEFPYYPLDVPAQKNACQLLNIKYRQPNKVALGGPSVSLKRPDLKTLRNTKGDGSCLFSAVSILITGTQHQNRHVRMAIVRHLLENEHLFINNPIFDCSEYHSMEEYIQRQNMCDNGWGGSTELYALAHLLQRRVYTFTTLSNTWVSHCPSRVDPTIAPPSSERALYIYHTGNHYMVVTSLSK